MKSAACCKGFSYIRSINSGTNNMGISGRYEPPEKSELTHSSPPPQLQTSNDEKQALMAELEDVSRERRDLQADVDYLITRV